MLLPSSMAWKTSAFFLLQNKVDFVCETMPKLSLRMEEIATDKIVEVLHEMPSDNRPLWDSILHEAKKLPQLAPPMRDMAIDKIWGHIAGTQQY